MSALLSGAVLQGCQEFTLFMAVPSRATSRHKQQTVGMQNSVEWNSDKMRQVIIFIGTRYHLLKFHFCRFSYHLTVVSMPRPLFKVWMGMWWAAVPRSRPLQLIWSPGWPPKPQILAARSNRHARSSRSVPNGPGGTASRSILKLARSGLPNWRSWSRPLPAPLGCFFVVLHQGGCLGLRLRGTLDTLGQQSDDSAAGIGLQFGPCTVQLVQLSRTAARIWVQKGVCYGFGWRWWREWRDETGGSRCQDVRCAREFRVYLHLERGSRCGLLVTSCKYLTTELLRFREVLFKMKINELQTSRPMSIIFLGGMCFTVSHSFLVQVESVDIVCEVLADS